jgi:hypothetical protein
MPEMSPTLVIISMGDSNAYATPAYPGRCAAQIGPRRATLRTCN